MSFSVFFAVSHLFLFFYHMNYSVFSSLTGKKIFVLWISDTVRLVCDTALFDIIIQISDLTDRQRDVVRLANGNETVLHYTDKFCLAERERLQIRIPGRFLTNHQSFN